ncbi:MAG: dihydrodipicolinate synthase family protein, partial [Gemmatimonadetes bacterium]|nr:dihydrodipicolinate synthase family protein [Gemmatimonadota bacterium]
LVDAVTNGESPTTSDEEKLACFATALDELEGRARVIAGTGSNDTAHAVQLTRSAVELGVDGVLVVTPYYNKPPREGLLRHFTAVAGAAGDTPVDPMPRSRGSVPHVPQSDALRRARDLHLDSGGGGLFGRPERLRPPRILQP